MDRRTRRAVTRFNSKFDPVFLAHAAGRRNAARTPWFQVRNTLTATRGPVVTGASPGSYAWAKQHAQETATEWLERELHRPSSSLNHRTARFAGKPYHWRQDYTGQLKLAAGESPW